ncbi:MAG: polysaccharide lyase family 8 super-sandwich domain-containing protein [Candidatus Cyclobacteriaceae bacterium M3_2C_046]
MKYPLIRSSIIWLLFFAYAGSVQAGTDLEMLRQKMINKLKAPEVTPQKIQQLINTLVPAGYWPDIDYEDVSRTGFEHGQHLKHMETMAQALVKPGSSFYSDKILQQKLNAALNYWLSNDFICDNWWWNQIGTPNEMVQILLLMDENLSEEQKRKAAPIANRANLDAWGARPGGDLIKIAGIMGKYALFLRNGEKFDSALSAIESEIHFATSRDDPSDLRGLQTDFSFHHRKDRVTATLSYGTGYANAFAEWAAFVADTKYSFSSSSIQLLVDFYLDGICQHLIYGKYPDPGAKNRSITRKGALDPISTYIPDNLLIATDYRSEELKNIIDIREGSKQPKLSQSRFFWHTEYFSHQKPDYFTSVRMFSRRNHTMEQPYNGEGLLNHHLGDGSNFISVTGKEYEGIFPVFDWQKIPGSTIVQKPALPSEEKIQQRGTSDFVGAATDGQVGLVAFDFKSPLDDLKAKKAWFFFEDEYVCLAAGISSKAGLPVATTLNQCSLDQTVKISANDQMIDLEQGMHELDQVNWIHHNQVGYLFIQPQPLKVFNGIARGNWRRINRQSEYTDDIVTKPVFKAWIDHGVDIQDQTYQYVVVPAVSDQEMINYARDLPLQILVNTPQLQAVKHQVSGWYQVVFYLPGLVHLTNDISLSANKPGLIMIQLVNNEIQQITVADPTRNLQSMQFTINKKVPPGNKHFSTTWNAGQQNSLIKVILPKSSQAGSSVTWKLAGI